MVRRRLLIKVVLTDDEGGCNFCTDKTPHVTMVVGVHEARRTSLRFCDKCLAELKEWG